MLKQALSRRESRSDAPDPSRDAKGRFKKGVSGNPAGRRPKLTTHDCDANCDPSFPESDARHWSPLLRAAPAFEEWLDAGGVLPVPLDAVLCAYADELAYWKTRRE